MLLFTILKAVKTAYFIGLFTLLFVEIVPSMSDGELAVAAGSSVAVRLPWGAVRERAPFPESVLVSTSAKPGAFALQMLFAEFAVLADKKIEQVLEPQVSLRLSLRTVNCDKDF
jgi:hypothetical protein